jgi:hypothetical protein
MLMSTLLGTKKYFFTVILDAFQIRESLLPAQLPVSLLPTCLCTIPESSNIIHKLEETPKHSGQMKTSTN